MAGVVGDTGAQSRFRPDIEGLRAVAVLFVLLYHAGLPGLSGGFVGVDIFFVVSGFVITSQLLRELERTGTVDLPQFYGRRAKRLLPAAALVLVVTAVGTWLLAPRVQWSSIAGDLVGASLYVVNWVFVGRSVDYLAEDVEPSPVLHFWSLAIEEQFYIIWPLLILGLVWLATRRSRHLAPTALRSTLALGLTAVVVLPSLAWSIWYTATSPQQAFFTTTTRLWELGLGALVALGAGLWLRMPRPWALAVAWAGLAAILLAGLVQSGQTPWPGSAALLPTLGAAAVIAGGFAAGPRGPETLLGLRGAVWVGGLSYSLYLWHWPLLRMVEWQFGQISTMVGLLVVTASVVPAWLSYRFVEHPIRYSPALNRSPKVALSVGANLTLVSLVAALVLSQVAYRAAAPGEAGGTVTGNLVVEEPEATDGGPGEDPSPPEDEAGGADEPGTADEPEPRGPEPPERTSTDDPPIYETITPDPLAATEDVPRFYDEGCQVTVDEGQVTSCPAGDPDGDVLVYVIGDSKIGQWVPAIEEIALANSWRVVIHTKSACAFTDVMTTVGGEPYEQCRDWGEEVMAELRAEEPDVVITGGLRGEALAEDGTTSREALVEGYARYWSELEEQGTRVIAIADNPQPADPPVYECVDEHRDDHLEQCSWDYRDGSGSEALRLAADQVDGVRFVDMNPWVCPGELCVGVWRNVLTYRQGSHITATFALALAEPLAEHIVPLVGPPAR
ncbi:acyltransferase family protein [Ornithinimicrobium sediminis]|uniref:acyltransferase family protein n=1 Tax=Ornithinimicrobium sediminis TaxID=2904603 RepID=UPI001E5AF957|nr:acyltransferase [Ornithinimicrobium sediminis]